MYSVEEFLLIQKWYSTLLLYTCCFSLPWPRGKIQFRRCCNSRVLPHLHSILLHLTAFLKSGSARHQCRWSFSIAFTEEKSVILYGQHFHDAPLQARWGSNEEL